MNKIKCVEQISSIYIVTDIIMFERNQLKIVVIIFFSENENITNGMSR